MSTTNIPRSRPKGSPNARAYGATSSDGTPLDAKARKVQKSFGWQPNPLAARPAGSPVAAVAGATDPNGYPGISKTLDALRLAFATPGGRGRVTKDKGVAQIACYDANGNLIGSVDAGNLTTFATASPAQSATTAPAAGAASTAGDGTHAGDPAVQAVAKAQRQRIMRAPTSTPKRPVVKTRVRKSQTASPGVLVMRRIDDK